MNTHDCLGQQTIAQFHEFIMFHIQKLICKQFLNLQLLVSSLDKSWVGVEKDMRTYQGFKLVFTFEYLKVSLKVILLKTQFRELEIIHSKPIIFFKYILYLIRVLKNNMVRILIVGSKSRVVGKVQKKRFIWRTNVELFWSLPPHVSLFQKLLKCLLFSSCVY